MAGLSTFPTTLDTFLQFMDVTSSDATNLKGFQDAIQSGDFTTATTYLQQIQNYQNKAISADRLNKLKDAIETVEKFYRDNIQAYITQKQSDWQTIIDQFSFLQNYSSTTQYAKNNMVLYNSKIYICIATPPSLNIVPTNTTYWRVFTIQGLKGESGGGVNTTFMFAWDSLYTYKVNMIVYYENQWWISKQESTNQTPQMGDYWDLMLTITQPVYPIQPSEPTTQDTNDLWFKSI